MTARSICRPLAALALLVACQISAEQPLELEPASPLWPLLPACAGGDRAACDDALLEQYRDRERVPRLPVALIACDAGVASACTTAAFDLRDSDPDLARQLRWRAVSAGAPACGTGDFGCRELVEEMRRVNFDLIDDDWARVAALIEPACRPAVGEPDPGACQVLARALARGCKDGCPEERARSGIAARESAIRGFEARCASAPIDCVSLAELYWWGTGGAPVERDRALSVVRRSCDGGYSFSCLRWARYVTSERFDASPDQRAAGVAELRRLCAEDAKDDRFTQAGACHLLAQLYRDGRVIPADPDAAARFAGLACALGYDADCAAPAGAPDSGDRSR